MRAARQDYHTSRLGRVIVLVVKSKQSAMFFISMRFSTIMRTIFTESGLKDS